MPALAITFGRLLGTSGAPLAVIACCAAVPSASGAYVLARQMGGDTKLIATILTLLVVPALYALWFRVKRDEPAADEAAALPESAELAVAKIAA